MSANSGWNFDSYAGSFSMPVTRALDSGKYATMVAGVCALFAIVAGVSAILGWALEIPRLTDWTHQGISMFTNAAICSLLSGLGIALLIPPPTDRKYQAARVLGSARRYTVCVNPISAHHRC